MLQGDIKPVVEPTFEAASAHYKFGTENIALRSAYTELCKKSRHSVPDDVELFKSISDSKKHTNSRFGSTQEVSFYESSKIKGMKGQLPIFSDSKGPGQSLQRLKGYKLLQTEDNSHSRIKFPSSSKSRIRGFDFFGGNTFYSSHSNWNHRSIARGDNPKNEVSPIRKSVERNDPNS